MRSTCPRASQVVVVGPRVVRPRGDDGVVVVIVVVAERQGLAGQRIAEHAGRPVTAFVHGATVDGAVRPAVWSRCRGGHRSRLRRRLVAGPRHRIGGHGLAVRRQTRSRGPARRPWPAARHRLERHRRGGRVRHRVPAPVAVVHYQPDGRSRAPRPLRRLRRFRHVIVPLRRHRLHRARAAHHLVVARHRGRRPSRRVRPLLEADPVHGPIVERAFRRAHLAFGRGHRRLVAAPHVQRLVRLPALNTQNTAVVPDE